MSNVECPSGGRERFVDIGSPVGRRVGPLARPGACVSGGARSRDGKRVSCCSWRASQEAKHRLALIGVFVGFLGQWLKWHSGLNHSQIIFDNLSIYFILTHFI
jgi:hypothetical protein